MCYRDLFVDLDDTLWDIHRNGKECLEAIYVDYGYREYYPEFEGYYDVYMRNNNRLWGLYRDGVILKEELIVERFLTPVREFGITDPEYAKMLNDDFLERTTRKTGLIDGTMELLEYLKPKYRMHILSNGFTEVQHKKIDNSGLRPYFDTVILSEEAGVNKPHPGMFAYALERAGARCEKTVMIGDSWEADIVGAYRSGIDQIWLNPTGEPPAGAVSTGKTNAGEVSPEDFFAGITFKGDFKPTYTVNSLKEIKEIL